MALYRGDPKTLEELRQLRHCGKLSGANQNGESIPLAAIAANAANGKEPPSPNAEKAAKPQKPQEYLSPNISSGRVLPLPDSQKSRKAAKAAGGISCEKPLSILRKAGLVPSLAGDAFKVLGLENLPEERREKCVRYYTAHRKEIFSELRHEEWYWKVFHLSWLRDAGLELSWDGIGQVTWKILPAFERIWNLGPERIVDHAFICWLYACKHRREIMAALQPCRGWKPDKPSGGCSTLEAFRQALEKERQHGVWYCHFMDMWLLRTNCPRWCGRWTELLTDAEREYWGAALWKNEKPSAA